MNKQTFDPMNIQIYELRIENMNGHSFKQMNELTNKPTSERMKDWRNRK